jgi:hypothetical protein
MPDYAKTIIYKLINYDYPDLVYVGSTTNFTNRKRHHKERCLNSNSKKHNLKVYVSMRKNGGWENWNMIKICDYPCNNKTEATQEEDKYMMELKSNLNMIRAFRPSKQYKEDNKDKKKEIDKQYYENNKDIIHLKQKQYNENNKEKIKETNKTKYVANKDLLIKYQSEYRKINLKKIKEKQKEKITCKCGCVITKSNLNQHEKSNKHINLMKNKV